MAPKTKDDRLPVVLIILDGLGDRRLPELDWQTPSEAATTPNLDEFARLGISGLHTPFGPGRAASSELSHWSMFGYDRYPFCGRAVLEARGLDVPIRDDRTYLYASLRPSEVRGDKIWIVGRATSEDEDDARALFESIDNYESGGLSFALTHLIRGEGILAIAGSASPDITDTDPLFEHLHPWMAPLALAQSSQPSEAEATRIALTSYLRTVYRTLTDHPTNTDRRRHGRPGLHVLTTKWAGQPHPVPTFEQVSGAKGTAITSTRLYSGFAKTIGLDEIRLDPSADHDADMGRRLEAAADAIKGGAPFVHVHVKSTDEAGHTKNPFAKLSVLEGMDPAFTRLFAKPFTESVVVITGDHATPSRDHVIHTGDPTPIMMSAPTVVADDVDSFGETAARSGVIGTITARDILPVAFSHANRPAFLGTRISPDETFGLPENPRPMETPSGRG